MKRQPPTRGGRAMSGTDCSQETAWGHPFEATGHPYQLSDLRRFVTHRELHRLSRIERVTTRSHRRPSAPSVSGWTGRAAAGGRAPPTGVRGGGGGGAAPPPAPPDETPSGPPLPHPPWLRARRPDPAPGRRTRPRCPPC